MTTTPKALPAEVSVEEDIALLDRLSRHYGVPHGPWSENHDKGHLYIENGSDDVVCDMGLQADCGPASAYIAACSPDRIRRLLSALESARSPAPVADSLASAGGVEVVAYLVSGGRIFKDQAVIHEGSALTRIAERKDGTVAHPLVKKSDHLAALTKEREVADGLARALKDAKVATQEAERLLHKAWAEHGLRVIDDGDGNAVDVAKAADRMDSAIDVIIAALTAYEASKGEA